MAAPPITGGKQTDTLHESIIVFGYWSRFSSTSVIPLSEISIRDILREAEDSVEKVKREKMVCVCA